MSRKLGFNLGSGQRPFSSTPDITWVNVDSQDKYEPDICCDLSQSSAQLQPGSADYVVLHHVLEHFGCNEANWLVSLCHNLLKSGGSVIITVPDMPKLVKMWLNGELDDQLFMTNVYGAYMGNEADRHRFGFTKTSLNTLLAPFGFSKIKQFDWRAIPGADIARDDRWILGVEAIK
jgi:hypothetical protein